MQFIFVQVRMQRCTLPCVTLCVVMQELALAYSLSLAGAYLIMATGRVPDLPL